MGNLKPTVVGLAVSMPILAMTAVALRLEARRLKKSRPGADDYTIIVSMVSSDGNVAQRHHERKLIEIAFLHRFVCDHLSWSVSCRLTHSDC